MAPSSYFLNIVYAHIWGKAINRCKLKPLLLNEEVYLPWDMPKTSKASYASTLTPPQKGHQNK